MNTAETQQNERDAQIGFERLKQRPVEAHRSGTSAEVTPQPHGRYFYVWLAVVVTAIVFAGFSRLGIAGLLRKCGHVVPWVDFFSGSALTTHRDAAASGVVHFMSWWSLRSVPASLTMVHGRSTSKKLPVPPLEISDCVARLNSRIAQRPPHKRLRSSRLFGN